MFFGTFNLTTSGLNPGHRAVYFFTSFPNWGQTLKSDFQIKSYHRLKFYFEKKKFWNEKKKKIQIPRVGRSGPVRARSGPPRSTGFGPCGLARSEWIFWPKTRGWTAPWTAGTGPYPPPRSGPVRADFAGGPGRSLDRRVFS